MLEDLARLQKVEIPATGLAGIYFLFWKGRLQYIGKSTNLYYRIARHYRDMQQRRRGLIRTLERDRERPELYLDFDEARVEFFPAEQIAHREFLAIQRYRPPNNVLLNRDAPKEMDQIQETDWFKELVAKADAASPDVKRRKFTGTSRPNARKFHKTNPYWREVRERMGA